VYTGLIWLNIGTSGGFVEYSYEPSGSIQYWGALEQLHNRRFLKKGLTPIKYHDMETC
jgi:hypothetical protein